MLAIEPFFQPIVDLAAPCILGYEVLSRGTGTMRSPIAMFAAARRNGTVWDLDPSSASER